MEIGSYKSNLSFEGMAHLSNPDYFAIHDHLVCNRPRHSHATSSSQIVTNSRSSVFHFTHFISFGIPVSPFVGNSQVIEMFEWPPFNYCESVFIAIPFLGVQPRLNGLIINLHWKQNFAYWQNVHWPNFFVNAHLACRLTECGLTKRGLTNCGLTKFGLNKCRLTKCRWSKCGFTKCHSF